MRKILAVCFALCFITPANAQIVLPGGSSGGGSGTVTSISAGCAGVVSPSPITTTGTISTAEVVNLQTGANYPINNTDCGKLVDLSNGSAQIPTIAQAGTGGNFAANWYADICNIGAGTQTLTPATSTINGAATLPIIKGQCYRVVSDGTNYQTVGAGTFGTTGSGNLVYATSPTLVTPILGTPTSVTLNNTSDVIGGVTMTLGSDATGDLYYRNSSGVLTRLAVCTGTNVLGASGGLPACVAQSGGGLTINSTTVSGGSAGNLLYTDGSVIQATSGITYTASHEINTQSIGATSTDGYVLTNTTAAASGAQQWSPRLRLSGQAWNTTATAATNEVDWIIENQPVQGVVTRVGSNLVMSSQLAGGGYTPVFAVSSPNVIANSYYALWLGESTFTTSTALIQTAGMNNTVYFNAPGASGGFTFLVNNGSNLAVITSAGLFELPQISSDATHTDATVCEDTTSHAFYSGSGTLGICLGTSSTRYKHDIGDLDVGLAEIMKLEPVKYKLNSDHGDPDKLLYGFTAEQGIKVLPKLAGLDDQGQPNTFDYLGVVPVLVKALQEQQAEIEQLKRKVR
jgi:hypothetical protein